MKILAKDVLHSVINFKLVSINIRTKFKGEVFIREIFKDMSLLQGHDTHVRDKLQCFVQIVAHKVSTDQTLNYISDMFASAIQTLNS